MDRKFESNSNNYNESNLNHPRDVGHVGIISQPQSNAASAIARVVSIASCASDFFAKCQSHVC
jgi:hypothetical protein